MKARFSIFCLTAIIASCLVVSRPSSAAPLLQLDFGRTLPDSVTQPGFSSMLGAVSQAAATATFGAYTVDLTGQGFFQSTSGNVNNVDPTIRALYSDYYYNNSTVNGVGVTLSISGLTPNTPYNLRVWSYDVDASTTVTTPTEWSTFNNTTGTTGTIQNIRDPVPTEVLDPENSVVIPVISTTGTVDLFGTSTAGSFGTRLNAFKLDDGTTDLLAVDFGQAGAGPSPLQTGFTGIYGQGTQSSHTEMVGAFTVGLQGQGFWNATNATRLNLIDASVRDFYRDYYYNNSTANGDGVVLTIDGVTPNTDYDLTLWSFDADASTTVGTPTVWAPINDTTGGSTTITNIRLPSPTTQYDPENSATIRVRSTGTTLEIFGTTTAGLGGTRLNGIELNAVVTAHPGDFDSDGDVDGADFVAWQTHFPTATGATLADGDADADGDVDGADFVVWQTNFPFTPGPGASPVPEPAAWLLGCLAIPAFVRAARRRIGRR